VLSNDFFVNLLDMNIVWESVNENEEEFESKDRQSDTGNIELVESI